MELLQELEEFISEFNQDNSVNFAIDSIRVEFSKQHKLEELNQLGKWRKLKKNSNILFKLKKRLLDDEITTAYQLEKHHIYFYNMQDAPKYRKAIMVIFGLKQYHKEPPPRKLATRILSILKDVTNVDICLDVPHQPKMEKFKKNYNLTQYITPKGVKTQTHYINEPNIMMIDKVVIYNKAMKNNLNCILWRFEALISIPNIKALALPLYEFKQLIEKGR